MTASSFDMVAVRDRDLDDVTALVKTLNWPHRREDIALFMRLGGGRVMRDRSGDLLGVALWWAFEPAAARLGLVMVDPARQGRGIGRRLVERVLDDAAGRSMKLLATEAGKPLYDSLGFTEIGACRQYQGVYGGEPCQDPNIRPAGPDDLPAILALDAAAFGAGRAPVMHGLMACGRTAVLDDGSGVAGFAMERDFGRGTVVGPIVAPSEVAAVGLFQALARPGFVRVDIPVGGDALARHLVDCGLSAAGSDSPVMVRGDWPDPDGETRLFALSSHALG